MKYNIVATLGPSTAGAADWEALLTAGASAFRLNTSHLSLLQLEGWLARLDAFLGQERLRPAVFLDLQGSKWRLGEFTPFELRAGERVELVLAEETRLPGQLPVPHVDFFRAAGTSQGEIVLNDAKVRLVVKSYTTDCLVAQVIQPGELSPRKGITYTAASYRIEVLSAKDQAIFRLADGFAQARYAISYLKDAVEMANYRRLLGADRYLVAKLEREPALDEAGQIAQSANELWLCRGDLGAELGPRSMAEAVHRFSARVSQMPTPTLLAGQVLEHMTEKPVPTRSELCYLHDAITLGYHGVVLSDETAVGRYPIESVRSAALFRFAGNQ